MKTSRLYIPLLFIFLSIGLPYAKAQKAIQVVSTTQQENYPWTDKSRLFINGEQADIELSTYSGTTLKCEIVRASRHSDKAQAETDLKKLKLLANQTGKTISLRNYVELSGSDNRPESKLNTTYKIQVPESEKGTIEIWNYFGNITITNLQHDIKFKLEFSNLNLSQYSGSSKMTMKYGEVVMKNTSGTIELTSTRTNIEIENLTGTAEIDATYAVLRLLKTNAAKQIVIEANKSELFLDIPLKSKMDYEIKTKNVEVTHLSDKEMEMLTDPDGSHSYTYKAANSTATAKIQLNTGTLNYIVQ